MPACWGDLGCVPNAECGGKTVCCVKKVCGNVLGWKEQNANWLHAAGETLLMMQLARNECVCVDDWCVGVQLWVVGCKCLEWE